MVGPGCIRRGGSVLLLLNVSFSVLLPCVRKGNRREKKRRKGGKKGNGRKNEISFPNMEILWRKIKDNL
jgi:hypothetical protein